MSSGGFSANSNTNANQDRINLSPIILDQVSVGLKLRTAKDEFRPMKAGQYKPYRGPEKVDHPSIHCFADPRVYNHSKGASLIYPFGRFAILSNGRRTYKALIGDPIPHRDSPKRSPSQETIFGHEQTQNQFTSSELVGLLTLPAVKQSAPYILLLDTFFDKLRQGVRHIIADKRIAAFNNINDPLEGAVLHRLEVYLEINATTISDEDLRKAFHVILCNSFGESNIQRGERSNDDEYKDTLLTWLVPSRLISKSFNGKKKFAIKFYRKGTRIRLEIQANAPSLDRGKQKGCVYRIEDKARDVAAALETGLRTLEREARKILEPAVDKDWIVVFEEMKTRAYELLPRSQDSKKLHQLLEIAAHQGFFESKDAKKLNINRRTLGILAGEFGFFQKRNRGLTHNDELPSKITRNPIYVLLREKISKKTRPAPNAKRNSSSPPIYPIFTNKKAKTIDDLLRECSGSATDNVKSSVSSIFNPNVFKPSRWARS